METLKDIEKKMINLDGVVQKRTADQKRLDLVMENCELFNDMVGKTFARVKVDTHYETHDVGSHGFKSYLAGLFFNNEGKTVSREKLRSITMLLSHQASLLAPQRIEYRVNSSSTGYYYDLCTANWTCIKVSNNTIETIPHPAYVFKRTRHQLPQVTPDLDKPDITKVLDFINLVDEDTRDLFLIALIVGFIPNIPRPMFFFYGEQGAAKSTASKICKAILDPSALDTASFPQSENELAQALNQHYALFFDNVTKISPTRSDALCRAVTGGGFVKRELYSDDDTVIYNFKRVIGINGINSIIDKPDLLDRSILFEMSRIEDCDRISEKVLYKKFKKVLPSILGGVFQTLKGAFARVENVDRTSLPRMADFAEWGQAVADELGVGAARFLKMYKENISTQNITLVEQSPFASSLFEIVSEDKVFEGTLSALLEKVNEKVDDGSKKAKDWPNTSQKLRNRIIQFSVALRDADIKVEFYRDRNNIACVRMGATSTVVLDEENHENTEKKLETKMPFNN